MHHKNLLGAAGSIERDESSVVYLASERLRRNKLVDGIEDDAVSLLREYAPHSDESPLVRRIRGITARLLASDSPYVRKF